jgi:N-acetyl-gamma-glutamyl-phosphate reductase
MMIKKIFIDGSAGTTGLRIRERLAGRTDLKVLTLPEAQRKDASARAAMLNAADAAFLCLPDEAAIESAQLVTSSRTVLLDTSTAHRTSPGWAYGFPELSPGRRDTITKSKRIAVPGCHASGFIALIYPLLAAGLIGADTFLTCFSLTGYSGGGKKMIAQYEDAARSHLLDAPRQYGLTQQHKHLKEMVGITGLSIAPAFCPVVADYYSGMAVTVPLSTTQLKGTAADVRAVYRELYHGPIVTMTEDAAEDGFYSALKLSGKDCMEISVAGNDERLLLHARYDNLGKGASGAAIECMNLAFGWDGALGLTL